MCVLSLSLVRDLDKNAHYHMGRDLLNGVLNIK